MPRATAGEGNGRTLTMAEQVLLTTRETKRSFGLRRGAMAVAALGLPFLGRQRITVTDQRIIIESGFLTRVRDDIEVFRIRDVVTSQSLWARALGVGDVVVRSTGAPGIHEEHVLRGVPRPVEVMETIRGAWNSTARPRVSTNLD
ncbi:PH domain-containing protein [Roseomonas sp. NAR14]|uniref:PH domain-containing protein n=1 Tax=Roseomonas acroporae TaxID=2937791 RepID=A0A9X1YK94_9PROT|nr:PH domain-containing protein [Roseomonas acroporae]MCK8787606.1 PH domain-containing protein [Roseomonas acroporae]